ncbi:MAG TPA: hypothetical protein VKS22_10300 [Candidatus Binataceae bacterium]|nr:hypothetical protein [Candidatus Binataceae bacterium]
MKGPTPVWTSAMKKLNQSRPCRLRADGCGESFAIAAADERSERFMVKRARTLRPGYAPVAQQSGTPNDC